MFQPTIHPWNQELWQRLTLEPARSNHALLLHGNAGLGKRLLSIALSHFVISDNHPQTAKLYEASSHPDLHVIMPESEQVGFQESSDNGLKLVSDYAGRYLEPHSGKPRRSITIDQVRKLSGALTTHPHISNNRVVVIFTVQAMNRNAANALLKSLEEPPAKTLFLLVSDDVSILPKTIRSRCSLVSFSPPDRPAASAWLKQQKALPDNDIETYLSIANNHPLAAIELYKSGYLDNLKAVLTDVNHLWMRRIEIVGTAKKWLDIGPNMALDILQKLAIDLFRFQVSDTPQELFFPVQKSWVQSSSAKVGHAQLVELLDQIVSSKKLLATTVDPLLVLETVAQRTFDLPKT